VERVDVPVVVRAPALSLVTVGQGGEVLVPRRLAAEDVVPDDAILRVQPVELVDAPALVGVEERFAQLADLVLRHRRVRPSVLNLPESR
jgi:hypothetical protein